MAMATLIKEKINWGGWLTVSEIPFIIIMAGAWQHAGRRDVGEVVESLTSCRQQEVN